MKERNKLAVKLIEKYQENKALIGTGHCRFYPTCSNYAKETYKKFNFFYASLLVSIRLLRCNPLAKRRYYPVKLTKKEKQDIKYLNNINQYLGNDFTDYLLSVDKMDNVDNLYPYIYDYYYLPERAHFDIATSHAVFGSRFIITKQQYHFSYSVQNKLPFDEYLKVVKELKENNFLEKEINGELKEYDTYLYPIDLLKIKDILKLLNINEGLILINNCDEPINYEDFDELSLSEKELKNIHEIKKNHPKLIIKTKIKSIVNYLSDVDLSINLYDDKSNSSIDYLYHINKKQTSDC